MTSLLAVLDQFSQSRFPIETCLEAADVSSLTARTVLSHDAPGKDARERNMSCTNVLAGADSIFAPSPHAFGPQERCEYCRIDTTVE
jgi:hypothetical protein